MTESSSTTVTNSSDSLDSSPEISQETLPSQQSSFPFASPEDIQKVLSFEDITSLVQFYEAVGWTPAMELQLLIDIIRTTDNDNTRLRALRDLQIRRQEILRDSGFVVKATKIQKNTDGGQTVFSTNLVSTALGVKSTQNENRSEINESLAQKKEIPSKPLVRKRKVSEATKKARSIRANTSRRNPDTGQFLPSGGTSPAPDNSVADGRAIKNTDDHQPSPPLPEREPDSPIAPSNAALHKPPTGETILRGVTR